MYYSKRQLYALGEPLGDSVTQRKAGGGMIYGGGGGGAPSGPTNTTVTNTNIPDYAQPYVSNMLNAAQSQIYTPDMTGFNPYVPYSTNPSDYVAGFSPLQQQAQSTAANMQVPGQYGAATGQTMQDINQFGRLGQQMGQAGNQYAQNATNGSIGAYMNPYIQQSLAPQLQLANQQYGIQGAAQQGAATSAGAFGGSRNALQQGLNQQNQMLAQNSLISQGYNNAFNQAQQAQQFGANLGLQGQQAQAGALASQMGGANQLAGIGTQQLGAQQNILNTQNQLGAQQQGQQQNIINQAVQNYATAQQYPYMQLGQLNAMLRGLPMQQSSTSMYQAAPSTVSQLGGLGIAGLGGAAMYNAATKTSASGGKIKAMAVGGAVPMNMMSDQQLGQVQQNPISSPMAKMNAQGLEQLHGYIQNNPEAAKIIQQGIPPAQQMAQAPQDRSGIASIATPPQMTQMAGGGIIAFADEGAVKADKSDISWENMLKDYVTSGLADVKSGKGTVSEAYKPLAETQAEDIKQQKAMLIPEFATRLGLGLMNSQGGRGGSLLNKTLQDVGVSGSGAVQGMTSNLKDINAAKKTLQAGSIEAAKADQARRDALIGQAGGMYQSEINKKIGLAQVAATRQAGLDAKEAALTGMYAKQASDLYNKWYNTLQNGEMKTHFEVHPEDLDKAAEIMVYKALPQVARDRLNLVDPRTPAVNPAANNAAPAPTTNNSFSSYFLGQPSNVQPNVVPFSSLTQNSTLIPK
jgi:hypothetical protein